jgi:hypothetical protein
MAMLDAIDGITHGIDGNVQYHRRQRPMPSKATLMPSVATTHAINGNDQYHRWHRSMPSKATTHAIDGSRHGIDGNAQYHRSQRSIPSMATPHAIDAIAHAIDRIGHGLRWLPRMPLMVCWIAVHAATQPRARNLSRRRASK